MKPQLCIAVFRPVFAQLPHECRQAPGPAAAAAPPAVPPSGTTPPSPRQSVILDGFHVSRSGLAIVNLNCASWRHPMVQRVAAGVMERNRWETAIRCLEVAVHPNTRDDEVIAAVNGFRRTAEGVPLSRICIEFACGGLPLAELAAMKDNLGRLQRENRELRRKLSVDEAAQQEAAQRLDAAHRRIFELTEKAAAAHRAAEAVEREFEDFRAAYARAIDGIRHDKADVRIALQEAQQRGALVIRPFSAFLAEARLEADKAASFAGIGNGSGRVPTGNLSEPPSWSA